MGLEEIPHHFREIMYRRQKESILGWLADPIDWVSAKDPIWESLDRLLTGENVTVDVSDTGVDCTLHEVLPESRPPGYRTPLPILGKTTPLTRSS